jgi:hypothetical protein
MPLEILSTIAALGTFLVIGATAVAAVVQLRHMRNQNQLSALIMLNHDFNDPVLQESLRFVQNYLPQKLSDANYRRELEARGFIDSRQHIELETCNWFDVTGTLLKQGAVEEEGFLELFARLAVSYWEMLEPVVAIVRRRRGPGQYANFEYLAIRAREYLALNPNGSMPTEIRRLDVADPWLASDHPASAGDAKS